MLARQPVRSLGTSAKRMGGQKAKRRKHRLREENPHLPVRATASTPTSLAMAHFDEFYSGTFKQKWPSMRLGLVCPQKYCALVNNFGDSEETVDRLEGLGCLDVGMKFSEAMERTKEHRIEGRQTDNSTEGEIGDRLPRMRESKNVAEEEALNTGKVVSSLDPGLAPSRLIDPSQRVFGTGGAASAMYDFVPTTQLKGMEDFVEESDYYDFYKKIDGDQALKVRSDPVLHFPKHLKVFSFPRGSLSQFPSPRPGILNTVNYYCMDAASLLPVLALDLKPGQAVLDMCAAPGGKSLVMLQTLYPATLHCNDVSHARVQRLLSVLDQFIGPGEGVGGVRNTVSITRRDGATMMDLEAYDRVLVDAPCFSDRHSVASDEGNIFVKQQVKERLKMPEQQTKLLKNGLLHLKPGGCLVYSTCTLSPIQNDGVVGMALRAMWEDTNMDFEVCDLTEAVKPFRFLSKFLGMKFGQMIVPFLPNNFGPMYFCKIRRVK